MVYWRDGSRDLLGGKWLEGQSTRINRAGAGAAAIQPYAAFKQITANDKQSKTAKPPRKRPKPNLATIVDC